MAMVPGAASPLALPDALSLGYAGSLRARRHHYRL